MLETERLLLRHFVPEDADAVQRQISDYEVARMLGSVPWPYPEGGAAEWIERQRGRGTHFAIVPKEGGEPMGSVGLAPDEENRRAEVGYWLGRTHWGQGYMTEAVAAIVDYGFRELGLNRIFGRAYTTNPASARVMAKAGMTHEGTHRSDSYRLGEFLDLAVYAILRDEWSG